MPFKLRRLIEFSTRQVAWIKKNRRYRPNQEVVKVNLGAGLSPAEGWINLDISLNAFFSKWPRPFLKVLYRMSGARQWHSQDEYCEILHNHLFIHHEVRYGIPFSDNTIDYLYSSHLLEHLDRDDIKGLLKEAHRVIIPEGVIRICVPDLEYAISLFQRGDKEQALNLFFPCSNNSIFSLHRYMYDFELLKKQLEKAGFHNINRCSFQQGATPDLDRLDKMPEQTLYVEARK